MLNEVQRLDNAANRIKKDAVLLGEEEGERQSFKAHNKKGREYPVGASNIRKQDSGMKEKEKRKKMKVTGIVCTSHGGR